MNENWAVENLQTIRTLMERSAVYRRALAPVMCFGGFMGLAAGLAGWRGGLETVRGFSIYWLTVGLVTVAGCLLLVRRQALKDGEALWSPPTRRVSQAMLPPWFTGLVAGLFCAVAVTDGRAVFLLPITWMFLHGCAVHAAGFFMPRGMKLFGWAFIILALILLVIVQQEGAAIPAGFGHLEMGLGFGAFQFAYGVYLYFTERRKHSA